MLSIQHLGQKDIQKLGNTQLVYYYFWWEHYIASRQQQLLYILGQNEAMELDRFWKYFTEIVMFDRPDLLWEHIVFGRELCIYRWVDAEYSRRLYDALGL